MRAFNQSVRLAHKGIFADSFQRAHCSRWFHTRSFQCENQTDGKPKKEEAVSSDIGGVSKVNLPPLKPVGRSNQHVRLLEEAKKKVALQDYRTRYINEFIVPLRELYFNNASRFLNSPKSPAKRAAGVLPNYTSYFPAEATKYDQTGMALSELQVHKKFNAWWMRTTGRGPTPKGQVAEKKKKKKK